MSTIVVVVVVVVIEKAIERPRRNKKSE